MLDRLLGLETEYAIRFTPAVHFDGEPPSRRYLYSALKSAIGSLVDTRDGRILRQEIWTSNGGGFRFEANRLNSGLIEGATPECRGPSAALLYQRAQDRLLAEAIARAEAILVEDGYFGDLGVVKNCRDAAGNIYGAQENYDVELASGWRLWLWRAGVALLTVPALVFGLVLWPINIAFLGAVVVLWLALVAAAFAVPPLRRTRAYRRLSAADVRLPLDHQLQRILNTISIAASMPLAWAMRLMVWALGFREVRRWLEPLLISRPVVSGAGTLEDDGGFLLSEKATGIYLRVGATSTGRDRGIFDVGNLTKRLCAPVRGDLRSYAGLYRRRQRLQLGLSDSNMCEPAEYLRIATAALVIDMAESGTAGEPPVVARPLAALRRMNGDLDLAEAIAIQRRYAELASVWIAGSDTPSLEAAELVRSWHGVLDALESDRESLIGQLDWVTKKSLLDRAANDAPPARKKIDLKYHELGVGYYAELERRGLVTRLISDEDADDARTQPPAGSPAIQRSALMREYHGARVSWDKVRVRGRLNNTVGGDVIPIDRYRD